MHGLRPVANLAAHLGLSRWAEMSYGDRGRGLACSGESEGCSRGCCQPAGRDLASCTRLGETQLEGCMLDSFIMQHCPQASRTQARYTRSFKPVALHCSRLRQVA